MGDGLNRRELLKRGAIAGGALWASPIMHTVGMAQMDGEDTSPSCRLKITPGELFCSMGAQRSFVVCASGCACDGGFWLVYTGSINGSTDVSGAFDLFADDNGCYDAQYFGAPGDAISIRLECRDAAGAVVAESAQVTLSLDCDVNGAAPSAAATSEGFRGIRIPTR